MDRSLFTKGILIVSFLVGISPTFVYAQDETSFDNIVREMKATLAEPLPRPKTIDSDSTRVIAGAALVGNYVNANAGSAMLSGFDLHLGVELFSPQWVAEMNLRSFNNGRVNSATSVSLEDYDLQLVHQNDLQKTVSLRVGGGLSAQYLKTSVNGNSTTDTTPCFVALIGVDKAFSPKFSIGPDVSYRLPLESDSGEKSSLDASLRVNFYF